MFTTRFPKKHRPATRNLPFFHPCQQRGRLRRTGHQQRAEGLAVHLQQIEAVEAQETNG